MTRVETIPLVMFILLLSVLLSPLTHAETSKRFVRIACVPEAGLLDIEERYVSELAWGGKDERSRTENSSHLARAGFYDPHNLKVSCGLGEANYLILSEQGEATNSLCGGDPAVALTVTRNGEIVLSKVFLGDACGLPFVRRLTIYDGLRAPKQRATEFCYSSGKDNDSDLCEWTSRARDEFNRRFPIDQGRLEKMVEHTDRR